MTPKFILILALLLLSSCSHVYVSSELKELDRDILKSGIRELAYDILDNPDKIKNFKGNYPQYFDSSIVVSQMLDTSYLNTAARIIKEDFSCGFWGYGLSESYFIPLYGSVSNLYSGYYKGKIDPKKEDVICIQFHKEDLVLGFYFIKRNSKYRVILINYGQLRSID